VEFKLLGTKGHEEIEKKVIQKRGGIGERQRATITREGYVTCEEE